MTSETRSRHARMKRVQGGAFGREAFLDVNGMKSGTWQEDIYYGNTALGYGLAQPAYRGVFGPHDCVMSGIRNTAAFYTRVAKKVIAGHVRANWLPLTEGAARAERDFFVEPGVVRVPELPRDQQQYLAIGVSGSKLRFVSVEFGIGKMQAAIDQVNRPGVAIIVLDLQRVVRMAYSQAEKANVVFPPRLFPNPDDSEAWQAWLDESDAFLVRAGVRKGKPAKVKAEANAREDMRA